MPAPAPETFIKAWLAAALPLLVLFLAVAAGTASLPDEDYWGAVAYQANPTFQYRLFPLDRDILYHAIGSASGNLQQADIVFIGHSRFLYGLHWQTLEEFSAASGVRVFNLSFAAENTGEFALQVLEKHGTKAKIFVVNAETEKPISYFDERLSPWSRNALETTRLGAYTTLFFQNFPTRLRVRLSQVIPGVAREPERRSYSSTKDGSFFPVNVGGEAEGTSIAYRDGWCRPNDRDDPLARRYIERLRRIAPGSFVVLTLVPHELGCPKRVRALAEALGVPFFEVPVAGLRTHDHSHLNNASARLYTAEILRRLQELDAFKALRPGS
jgi:hypothetical protein